MQLVEDGQPIMGNGLCFLCETQCDRRFAVINTGYHFDPDYHSPLVGPKYVCEFCAGELGRLVGLVKPEENEPVVKEVVVNKTDEFIQKVSRDIAALRKEVAKAT